MGIIDNINRKRRKKACQIYKGMAFDVILVAGQSNADGYGMGDIGLAYRPDASVFMWDYKKGIVFAEEHTRCGKTASSFYLYFAEEYIKRGLLRRGRKILIVNTAAGGTGFKNKNWGENDVLYKRMADTVNEINSLLPDVRWRCMLWHQGEADVNDGIDTEVYRECMMKLISGVRSLEGLTGIPFIAGGMVEEWKKNNPFSYDIENVTKEVLQEFDGCGFVSSDGLKGNEAPDIIHFSRKSNIEFASRYLDKYVEIIVNKK